MAEKIDRRTFLAQSAALTTAAIVGGCHLPRRPNQASAPNVADQAVDVARLPKLAPELEAATNELLAWAQDHGWLGLIGCTSSVQSATDSALFEQEPSFQGAWCRDFGGRRSIQPGYPELSALYHVLAHPEVRLDAPAGNDPAHYPSLEQLDLLENFIYALAEWPMLTPRHALAVLAYEYRPVGATPLRRHADLVFSRTGIARIGQEVLVYDKLRRRHSNQPATEAMKSHFAVTPARYGLFLVEKVPWAECPVLGSQERSDEDRTFVRPVRKIFAGDRALDGAPLRFGEQHRNESLLRLSQYDETFRADVDDPDPESKKNPPFLCISSTFDGAQVTPHNCDLVKTSRRGSSVLVASVPAPLVRYATRKEDVKKKLYFRVPKYDCENRRYSSLKLLHGGSDDTVDAVVENRYSKKRANRFNAPRNAPVFVNIRYAKDERDLTDEKDPLHLDGAIADAFSKRIKDGGYRAALFEDSICDGAVVAELGCPPVLPDTQPAQSSSRLLVALRSLEQLPAFSIVTAPDFFPEFAAADLDAVGNEDDFFYAGGISPLSFTRLRANPALRIPGTDLRAFPPDLAQWHFQETVTAVVSRGEALEPLRATPVSRSGFLPDSASAVFYPGWDVTYVGAKGDERAHPADDDGLAKKSRFLGTYGLGSPFPEDMKLCAAANGMWPASSPDAARTFQGSLQRPRLKALGCSDAPLTAVGGTAVPLLDNELGFHKQSPAVRLHGMQEHSGWDGEYGPFLERVSGELVVNYAQIDRVDYVENALRDRFDASLLRGITLDECLQRMDCLRRCLKHIDTEPRKTHLWLVSAEGVGDWNAPTNSRGPRGIGFPDELPIDALRVAQPGITGAGYLFIFVKYDVDDGNNAMLGQPPNWVRSRMPCQKVYIGQVSAAQCASGSRGNVASTMWDPARPLRKRWKWSRASK